ncbi:NrtR DNA-binding winged helix domain-containing protein [Allomuricauda sp. NBRC 101325]|uniref:NUDIX hydrolase n=1 Tax=Allomuricauda sp. NBRC 101325 TaxID=1113758 RepID=UPI0024A3B59D|nr:NUDIX domain-containing protein [Muricauda sp. NBRC 101325]GLU44781.1 hypothetical protein Musp01_24050 [Muricauda sp. NBRC 101325]
MDLKDFYEKGAQLFLPNLSIDLVIIGYSEDQLKCLLLQLGDKWILPGGYILRTESVDDATLRILQERTGLNDPHFKFLSVFGEKDRQFKKEWEHFFKTNNLPFHEDYWTNDRFVTLAYYSLVDLESTSPVIGNLDTAFGWFDLDNLPDMMMDHRTIAQSARERLKEDVSHEYLSYNLLPVDFTMPQLHQLHQTILGEELDRSRFQKKMLGSGMFERLPKLQTDSPGRKPYLYRVKKD